MTDTLQGWRHWVDPVNFDPQWGQIGAPPGIPLPICTGGYGPLAWLSTDVIAEVTCVPCKVALGLAPGPPRGLAIVFDTPTDVGTT
jgi:hypothetical protein